MQVSAARFERRKTIFRWVFYPWHTAGASFEFIFDHTFIFATTILSEGTAYLLYTNIYKHHATCCKDAAAHGQAWNGIPRQPPYCQENVGWFPHEG